MNKNDIRLLTCNNLYICKYRPLNVADVYGLLNLWHAAVHNSLLINFCCIISEVKGSLLIILKKLFHVCFYIFSTIRIVRDNFSVPIHIVGLGAYALIGDEKINCVGFLIRCRRWSYSQINDSSSYRCRYTYRQQIMRSNFDPIAVALNGTVNSQQWDAFSEFTLCYLRNTISSLSTQDFLNTLCDF